MPSDYYYTSKWTKRYQMAMVSYECQVCGHKWEAWRTDESAKECPQCLKLAQVALNGIIGVATEDSKGTTDNAKS